MNNQILQKPEWLKFTYQSQEHLTSVKQLLKEKQIVTVCQESKCPNLNECWNGGTATFMILGDTCTRGCKFCNIKTAKIGKPIDKEEPQKILDAAKALNLDYVVITSVDRDDLADQGATHFAECISKLKKEKILVETLIPDFRGEEKDIAIIINAKPDVIAHNIETVERLQKKVRDIRAGYEQSLNVLNYVKKENPTILTKSSIMLGHGETKEEVHKALEDLRKNSVDIVTFGQYLRPSKLHKVVDEYITPEQFKKYQEHAEKLGFLYVASGPFVRSSYKAGELYIKNILGAQHA